MAGPGGAGARSGGPESGARDPLGKRKTRAGRPGAAGAAGAATSPRRRLLQLALGGLVLAGLDQLGKLWALAGLAAGPVTVIPGFFELILVHNQGASFGAFAQFAHARLLLVAATLVALGVVAWLAVGDSGRDPWARLCLGLVTGGALGNLVDRLRLGTVVDFLVFHLGAYTWPAFNLADCAITVGGLGLAYLLWRGRA